MMATTAFSGGWIWLLTVGNSLSLDSTPLSGESGCGPLTTLVDRSPLPFRIVPSPASAWQWPYAQTLTTFARAANDRKVPTARRQLPCRDFLKEQLEGFSCGEIAQSARCSKRAAQDLRAGKSGMSMEHLVNMCRANAAFRAAFIEFLGGEIITDPAISQAINAYVRSQYK